MECLPPLIGSSEYSCSWDGIFQGVVPTCAERFCTFSAPLDSFYMPPGSGLSCLVGSGHDAKEHERGEFIHNYEQNMSYMLLYKIYYKFV